VKGYVVIKQPGEPADIIGVPDGLDMLTFMQMNVGGFIAPAMHFDETSTVIVCDDGGLLGMEENTMMGVLFLGTVLVVRSDGPDFEPMTFEEARDRARIINERTY
jgi:hypothetical protein